MSKKNTEVKEVVGNEVVPATVKTVEVSTERVLSAEEKTILEDANKYGITPSDKMSIDQILFEFERVPFQAFADGDKYKDDLHIRLNGRNVVIQRGITVYIPRCVRNIIDKSQKQRASANQKMAEYMRAYSNNENKLSY